MNSWSNYLTQIEIAAHKAPASMLRLLMEELVGAVDHLPEDSAEYGRMLLLKLDHLLTQQQALAAQANSAASPGYLAPHLVIQERAARRSRA